MRQNGESFAGIAASWFAVFAGTIFASAYQGTAKKIADTSKRFVVSTCNGSTDLGRAKT